MNVHRISRAGLRNKVNIVNKLKQFVFQFILLVQVLDVDISIDGFEFKAGEFTYSFFPSSDIFRET